MQTKSIWNVRKEVLVVDTVHHDGGPNLERPLLKGAIACVLQNPFAGRYADSSELIEAMEALRPIALAMAERLVHSLGGVALVQTFGKGAIVGTAGEIEHAALWHAPGGAAVRQALGGAKAQVPAAKKMGVLGATLDVPLHYIHASMVRSHYDVMPVCLPDAPRPSELAYLLTMSTGGRIHARIGGLDKTLAKGLDGLV